MKIWWTFWRIFFCKVESHTFELIITLQIWFEVLKQHNFFIYRGRVIKKVMDLNLLDRDSRPNFTHTLNINKMKKVWWSHDFSAVIKENSKSSRRQFIAKPILWTKIYKLNHYIITLLLLALFYYLSMRNEISCCLLYFCKLLVIRSFLFNLNLVMNRIECCSHFSWLSRGNFIFFSLKGRLQVGRTLHPNLVWLTHRDLIWRFLMWSENSTWVLVLLCWLIPFLRFKLHLLGDYSKNILCRRL